MYICIPIQCPQDNFEDSSLKPKLLYKENNTTNTYGLNFELEYEIRYTIYSINFKPACLNRLRFISVKKEGRKKRKRT